MLKEFKEFAAKGNVLDLAVGLIMGVAFGKIVASFVADVLMPPVGLLLGRVDFSNLYINLSGKPAATLAEAKAAGLATINYGVFVSTVVDFLVVAFVVFLLVRQVNRMKSKAAPAPDAAPAAAECPFCLNTVPVRASRCGHCTSALRAA